MIFWFCESYTLLVINIYFSNSLLVTGSYSWVLNMSFMLILIRSADSNQIYSVEVVLLLGLWQSMKHLDPLSTEKTSKYTSVLLNPLWKCPNSQMRQWLKNLIRIHVNSSRISSLLVSMTPWHGNLESSKPIGMKFW